MTKEARMSKLKKMAAYGTADMLGGGVFQLISSYFLAYLTFVEGMNPALAGACIMIGKIWDGISDPIMGVIVEKTRTRFGSVRPYFLIGALPIFITYFMLWYSFGINSEIAKAVYYTIAYVLFSTAFTVVIIPYEALLPRMVDNYSERTNYISSRMIFSGLACVISTYIYEFIINSGGNSTLSPELKGRFGLMGVILGIFFALPVLVTFMGTKENPRTDTPSTMSVKQIFKEYGEVLRNRSYRKYYIMNILSAFLSGMVITGMSFFSYIILSQDKILGLTVITIVLTIKGATEIGFFPVNVVLMKKYSKHMPYKVDIPLIILACAVGLFIPEGSSAIPFIISISFLGMGVSCLGFVPMSLLPDLTDVDEMIYGKRREGICSGLATLGKKVASGVSMLVTGVILAAFGLDAERPEAAAQTASTMWGVKIVYAVIPIVFATLILLISYTYKVDSKNHNMIKTIIAKRREEGYAELTDSEKKECEALSGISYEKLWIATREAPQTE
jgi:oligogalacturonide transporter